MKRHWQFASPGLMAGIILLAAIAAIAPASADILMYDTGAPHQVTTSGLTGYYGLASGMPGTSRGWLAIPFKIAADTTISQADVYWYSKVGYEGVTIKYIIWNRTGLTAPATQYASGDLGAYVSGGGSSSPSLHQYAGLSIPIVAGDYYFTMYADGIGTGNNKGYSAVWWQLGGDLQLEELEQSYVWRQGTAYPPVNFTLYNASAMYTPGPGMADAHDIWNASFALYAVPEPGSLFGLGLGLAALAARLKSRRTR